MFMSNSQKKKVQFRGKQILLLGLVALVITAGYYRWTIEKSELSLAVPAASDALPANAENSDSNNSNDNNGNNSDNGGNGGENQGGENAGGTPEISKLRQERDSARGQSVEEWRKIAQSADTSPDGKKDAEKKISQSAENADKERKIETMVKAKGYDDCFAYVDGESASVTVQGGEIDGSKVAQIKDIIVSETNVPVKNIKINAM